MKNLTLTITLFILSFSVFANVNSPMEGFSRYDGNTGGNVTGATTYVVTNCNGDNSPGSLKYMMAKSGPKIINFTPLMRCTINWTDAAYINESYININGIGAYISISGQPLYVYTGDANPLPVHDVKIRNITFINTDVDYSAIGIAYGSNKVWIDHCTFQNNSAEGDHVGDPISIWNYGDNLPITGITISWSFFKAPNAKAILIGASDTSTYGKINVSISHNYFRNVSARSPRVHGLGVLVHMWNNYLYNWHEVGANISEYADFWAQNNYFEDANNQTSPPDPYNTNSHYAVNWSYGAGTYPQANSAKTTGNYLAFSGTATAIPIIGGELTPPNTFNTGWIPYSYVLETANTALVNELTSGAGANAP